METEKSSSSSTQTFEFFTSRNSSLNKTRRHTRAPNLGISTLLGISLLPPMRCSTCARARSSPRRGCNLDGAHLKGPTHIRAVRDAAAGRTSSDLILPSGKHLAGKVSRPPLMLLTLTREGGDEAAHRKEGGGRREGEWHQAGHDGPDSRRWHLPACLS